MLRRREGGAQRKEGKRRTEERKEHYEVMKKRRVLKKDYTKGTNFSPPASIPDRPPYHLANLSTPPVADIKLATSQADT
ncbi:hypothetical protein Pmani_025516 [Petrolisthes manimaculis]|uniref:Uncharacterized protein n=1 Tax=Petrolisthes manimaculis TaxID=1843537 RepID=A0AAE1U140_9EUCA|nr:hypothetical protein Pmani_025516 [Petrolisthes manimaculis]